MAGKDRQLIEGLEREWRDALCTKDMERLRSLVHPDFVLIGTRSTGPFQMHRDECLEAIHHREVNDIVETEFFRDLQSKADRLRRTPEPS